MTPPARSRRLPEPPQPRSPARGLLRQAGRVRESTLWKTGRIQQAQIRHLGRCVAGLQVRRSSQPEKFSMRWQKFLEGHHTVGPEQRKFYRLAQSEVRIWHRSCSVATVV